MLKEDNFGVVILCSDGNTGALRYTTNSIKFNFTNVKYLAVAGENVKNFDVLSSYCKIYKGGKTITSLIDTGISKLTSEWCLIVMAGSLVRYPVFKKYQYFSEDKAVLYPVIDRKYIFNEASINGIFMRKSLYEDVGEFGDNVESINEVKLFWAAKALEKGYKFKAIVGARFV